MNILICSQHGELQVAEVVAKLEKRGVNAVVFERYRKDHFVTYHYGDKTSAHIEVENTSYNLDSMTFPVVWYRPKPILQCELPGESGSIEERFCINEWRSMLRSFDVFLQESLWMNSIWASQMAGSKPYQLRLAQEQGLLIPKTIITNDASKALGLFKNGRVIYKTLSSFISSKRVIYTNEIYVDDVGHKFEQIAMAPGIFQNYIEKKYELRVTVIGTEMFVARINSQERSETEIDWRRCADPNLYEMGALTTSTADKLLRLHDQLGLVYAAYDFIVDEYGNEIFLECNPSGQWLWLENILGIEISQMVANKLIDSARRG